MLSDVSAFADYLAIERKAGLPCTGAKLSTGEENYITFPEPTYAIWEETIQNSTPLPCGSTTRL